MTEFRQDIQGLRAIAVLPVVLFHFGVGLVSGGFVGVDVFFVISGFVIGGRLMADIGERRFSLAGFYRRRARRILPALLMTCLLTLVVAWWVLLPPDFLDFGRSLIAVNLSAANFFFWKTSGYFAPESQSLPLLHCWSLAVEEQFYLFMPLAMMAVGRWCKGRWLAMILPVLVLSLGWCVASTFLAPSAGFYLLPSRAWELMLGAAVAAGAAYPAFARVRQGQREALAGVGLVLVLGAMFWLDQSDVFPAWNALAPCLGAAFILWAGLGQGPLPAVNRLLGCAPLRFFGAISYCLYLVHWPVAAFFHYRLMRDPIGLEPWAMLAGSIALASCMWSLVEQGVRKPSAEKRRATRFALIEGFASVLALGGGVTLEAGVPSRFPDYAGQDFSAQSEWGGAHCFNEKLSKAIDWNAAACTRTHGGAQRILLWGDSFAAHYTPGLIRAGKTLDSEVLQYTFAGCPPIFAFSSLSRLGCGPSNAAVPAIVLREKVDMVVLSARWTDVPRHTLERLHETVSALLRMGVQVVVIGQSPEFAADVRRLDYSTRQVAATEGRWKVSFDPAINQLLARQAQPARFIDPMASLCDGDRCLYREGSRWLYADYGHFSVAGSQRAVAAYFPRPRSEENAVAAQ